MSERTGTPGSTSDSRGTDAVTGHPTDRPTDTPETVTERTSDTTDRPIERTDVTTDRITEDAPETVQETAVAEGPARRRSRGTFQRWRARIIVLLMIAAAVWAAMQIIQAQDATDAAVPLEEVTLTSQSIPVETATTGVVTSVQVRPGQRVARGQPVGVIEVTTTNSEGETVLRPRTLTAPRPGIVVDEPRTVGSVLMPGVAFVELYDPTTVRFETELPLTYLSQLAPGMSAELEAEGLDEPVEAVVQRAVPRVGTDQDTAEVPEDEIQLILVPRNVADVARLIPGLQFTGTVDTRTGDPVREKSVYVG